MKHITTHYSRFLLLLILIFGCRQISSASDYDFKSGSLYYDIISEITQTVTVASGEEASGDVIIPASVTNDGITYLITGISNMAFSGNSALTAITIPEQITSIGKKAFYDCPNLTTVVYNAVRAETTDAVFAGSNPNNTITSVNIGDKVESIPQNLFSDIRKITQIIVPNSVKEIHNYAFKSCSELETILLPNTLTYLGMAPFIYTKYIDSQSGIAYVGSYVHSYEGTMPPNAQLQIKDGTLGIAAWAFWQCSELVSIDIPQSVTFIGQFGFSGCNSLKSIKLPSNLTSIETGLFSYCSSLTSIDVPDKVVSIGHAAFLDCTSLREITLGEGLETTDGTPFYSYVPGVPVKVNYNSINATTRITLPSTTEILNIGDKVKHIPAYLCSGSKQLKTVNFGNSVESIGEDAFRGCSELISIDIPESVTFIGKWAFAGCSSFKSIKLPPDLTSVEDCLFSDCSGLTSIEIPDKVTFIGSGAFWDCTSLTEITLGEALKTTDGAPFDGAAITKINYNCINATNVRLDSNIEILNIGDKVKHIPDNLCINCLQLKTVNFSNSLESIGEYAFFRCGDLSSLALPESLKIIGEYAFRDCIALTSITFPGQVAEIGDYAFYSCPLESVTVLNPIPPVCGGIAVFNYSVKSDAELNVPEASLALYREAYVWKEFLSIATSVETPEAGNAFHFDNSTNILNVNGNNGKLSVFSANGKKAFETTLIDGDNQIDLSGLSAGVYILKQGNSTYKFMKK